MGGVSIKCKGVWYLDRTFLIICWLWVIFIFGNFKKIFFSNLNFSFVILIGRFFVISEIIFDFNAVGIIKGRFLVIKRIVASISALYFVCRTSMIFVLFSRRDTFFNAKVFKLVSIFLKVLCLRLLFRCRVK